MKTLYKILIDWLPTIKYIYQLKFLTIYLTIIIKDNQNDKTGTLINFCHDNEKEKQRHLLIQTYGEEFNDTVINNIIKSYEMIRK